MGPSWPPEAERSLALMPRPSCPHPGANQMRRAKLQAFCAPFLHFSLSTTLPFPSAFPCPTGKRYFGFWSAPYSTLQKLLCQPLAPAFPPLPRRARTSRRSPPRCNRCTTSSARPAKPRRWRQRRPRSTARGARRRRGGRRRRAPRRLPRGLVAPAAAWRSRSRAGQRERAARRSWQRLGWRAGRSAPHWSWSWHLPCRWAGRRGKLQRRASEAQAPVRPAGGLLPAALGPPGGRASGPVLGLPTPALQLAG